MVHLHDLVQAMRHPALTAALLLGSLCGALPAHATNGYFSHGYGIKAQGQAGVGIAWGQDALAAATNPANTAAVGDRLDLGLSWFAPRRSADIVGNAFAPDASYSGDGKKNFFLPEFGLTRQISNTLGVGVAVYGNGGLNTQYGNNPYARFGATGTAGVNLEQLFITPSVAWKPNPDHSLGLALNISYQRFSAQGIGVFAAFSASPTKVSDQGNDSSTGAGLRIGWSGKLTPQWSAGATWASKIRGQFNNYKGLFADGGRFDVPENYGLGLAFSPNADWTLGADVQTIRYSRVAAVGNPINSLFQGAALGSANGPGFGWRDQTVLKLALSRKVNDRLVVRGGLSHANQVVPQGQTFFNILAPGVVQDHLTFGATWQLAGGAELSGFVARGFGKSVSGSVSIPPGFPPAGLGGGNANVRLSETIIGVSYAWGL
jgi:long-chain fatty acid transport protein